MRFDTQNPFLFSIVIALAVIFLFLSFFGTMALTFLLLIVISIDRENLIWGSFLIALTFFMFSLRVWNFMSAAQLLGDMNIKRLIGIMFRSIIIILPFAIIGILKL